MLPVQVQEVQQMAGLQVKELSAKLADAESKKAALETMLALRDRQASEVTSFPISLFQLEVGLMQSFPCS